MNPQNINISGEQDKQKLLEARLSDTEKGYLFSFCQTEGMVFAVEKALNYALYQMGTIQKEDKEVFDVNWAYGIGENTHTTDEQVGHMLRVKREALVMMGDAFNQIKKFGVEKVVPTPEVNPAL